MWEPRWEMRAFAKPELPGDGRKVWDDKDLGGIIDRAPDQ